MQKKIIRLAGVKAMTGLSRSTLYQMIAEGEFPSSISLGPRAGGWLESDVQAWIEQKINAQQNARKKIGRRKSYVNTQ